MKKKSEQETKKGTRLLLLYEKLCQGKKLVKADQAKLFEVEERTIQRDLQIIKRIFKDNPEFGKKLKCDRKNNGEGGHYLEQSSPDQQTVLAMSKVLLESRAFPKEEIQSLIDKLIAQCHPEDRIFLKEMVNNEQFYYEPLKHNKSVNQTIWDLSQAKFKKRCIKISYRKVGMDESVERIVEPLSIIFSEFYFYLVAYIKDRGYDFPAIYRIDRIQSYEVLDDQNNISYTHPYKEGELRRKIQFMQSGKLQKIRFKFWGESLEAVLDRLPTAEVIGKEGDKYIIEAEVFGRGIKMWLLSQGQYIEVLGPEDFREEMRRAVGEMAGVYYGHDI